jgi:malate dehydrogenase (oxaloacetate-decarboxylating)(NADP+)
MNKEKDQLRTAALFYHRNPKPGKVAIQPTKQLANQYDLSMAYSRRGRCRLRRDRRLSGEASTLTSRANLVGVITNGTAVLGLGAIGPLAAKPVMEGKAVLFKKFANIDVFDLEIEERDPDRWWRSSPRWSRPLAASTSKTSRRRSASTSRRSCANG